MQRRHLASCHHLVLLYSPLGAERMRDAAADILYKFYSGFSFSNYIFLCCGKKENLLITRFIVDARFMHIKWILSGADFEADVAGVGGEAGHVPGLDVVGDVLPGFARVFAVKTLERILHLDHAVLHLLADIPRCHPSWQLQEATDWGDTAGAVCRGKIKYLDKHRQTI